MSLLAELRASGATVELQDAGKVRLLGATPELVEQARVRKVDLLSELQLERAEREDYNRGRIRMCLGLERVLVPLVTESGDQADALLSMVRAYLHACRDHWGHGDNWFKANRAEFEGRCRVLYPIMFPGSEWHADRMLEGQELLDSVRRVFARRPVLPTSGSAAPSPADLPEQLSLEDA